MKKFATAILIGATLMAAAISPSQAAVTRPNSMIRVNGRIFEGGWALIGDRPYVNVDSFAKAVGLPHQHNAKYWYLAKEGTGKGSPYQLQVESGSTKIPTVRYAGATMVDLQSACTALKIPYHRDYDGYFEVGNYRENYMKGSHYRAEGNRNSRYNGSWMHATDTWSDGDRERRDHHEELDN